MRVHGRSNVRSWPPISLITQKKKSDHRLGHKRPGPSKRPSKTQELRAKKKTCSRRLFSVPFSAWSMETNKPHVARHLQTSNTVIYQLSVPV